jgi:hypothetical protein
LSRSTDDGNRVTVLLNGESPKWSAIQLKFDGIAALRFILGYPDDEDRGFPSAKVGS